MNPTDSGSPSQSTPPAKAQKAKKEDTPTVTRRRSARTAFHTVIGGKIVDLVEEEEGDEEAE